MRGQMTHLDTDVLAEFRAGLITGRRGARITAHLGGCERCTALDQQLAGVRSLLASVPAPTMPDSVAHRLDTVLAAEVAQRHAAGQAAAQGEAAPADQAERAGGDGTRESSASRRPGGNRGFRLLALRVLAPAAAGLIGGATLHASRPEMPLIGAWREWLASNALTNLVLAPALSLVGMSAVRRTLFRRRLGHRRPARRRRRPEARRPLRRRLPESGPRHRGRTGRPRRRRPRCPARRPARTG